MTDDSDLVVVLLSVTASTLCSCRCQTWSEASESKGEMTTVVPFNLAHADKRALEEKKKLGHTVEQELDKSVTCQHLMSNTISTCEGVACPNTEAHQWARWQCSLGLPSLR